MTKEELKQRTLEIIDSNTDLFKTYFLQTIDNIDEDDIKNENELYFLPKAFYQALHDVTLPRLTTRSYGMNYVRKNNKWVKYFKEQIYFNRTYRKPIKSDL